MSDAQAADSPTPDNKPPRRRHRLRKLAISLVVLFLAALVLLPYLLPTSWIRAAAREGIQSALGRDTRIEGVSWGWISGVSIEGITIGETDRFGGGNFLSIKRLSLDVSLLQLALSIGKRIKVDAITIDSPRITIVRAADGTLNIQTLAAGPAVGRPRTPVVKASMGPDMASIELVVRRVRVRDGWVAFKDLGSGVEVTAEDVNANIDADFSGPQVKGSADFSFSLVQPGSKGVVKVAAVEFSMDKKPSAASLETLNAVGTLRIDGVELAQVLSAATGKADTGLLSGRVYMEVPYEFDGEKLLLTTTGGKVRGVVLGKEIIESGPVRIGDVTFGFDLSMDHLDSAPVLKPSTVRIKTDFAEVALSLSEAPLDDLKTADVEVSGKVDPSLVPRVLAPLPEGLEASGPISFTANLSGAPAPRLFDATLDATDLRLAGVGIIDKKPGKTAAFSASGALALEARQVVVEKFAVELAGASIAGSAALDLRVMKADWKISADFRQLAAADYVAVTQPLVIKGRLQQSGTVYDSQGDRPSGLLIDTTFDELSIDLTSREGRELALGGRVSLSSERMTSENLILTIGPSPITINARIIKPFHRPTGTISARGKKVNLDDLAAIAAALAEAAPEKAPPAPDARAKAPAAAPKPRRRAPGTTSEAVEMAREEARELVDVYIESSDIRFDLRLGEATFQGYQAANMAVDARLVSGTLAVSNAGFDIFGGKVSLDSKVQLTGEARPAALNLKLASLQASDPTRDFLGKLVHGMDFSGVLDLDMAVNGDLSGSKDDVAKSFSGSGSFSVSDGVISLAQLPSGLSLLFPKTDLTRKLFSRMDGTLSLSDGTLKSESLLPGRDLSIFTEGSVHYMGENSQAVGIIPRATGKKITLVRVRNGHTSVEVLPEELLQAGLAGLLKKHLQKDDESAPPPPASKGQKDGKKPEREKTKEEKIIDAVEDILDIFGGGKD